VNNCWKHNIIGALCVIGIILVFLFQQINFAAFFSVADTTTKFIVNRTIRFLLNDTFTIGLIYALFKEKKYVLFSIWVQFIGLIFILIPYFVLKVQFPKYNGPLISYLHRLVLNPTLLLLLIPAFYYQRKSMRQLNDDV
jgi:exosortase F-associated protein